MTVIDGLPISKPLVDVLKSRTHINLDVPQTDYLDYADIIVEITYHLIGQMDTIDSDSNNLGELQTIKGMLVNLGSMREAMIDLNLAILDGHKMNNHG